MDGLDVLFRIALGILRSNEAELLRCESVPAVYVSLENLPTRMWEADKLLQVRHFVPFLTFKTLAQFDLFFNYTIFFSWKQTFEVHSFIHRLLANAKCMSHRSVNSFLRKHFTHTQHTQHDTTRHDTTNFPSYYYYLF